MHAAIAATACPCFLSDWRSVEGHPEPPSLPCSWLLHVDVSCEFSAILWVALEGMWILELWHCRDILTSWLS